jgi:GTPase SAR1 family protein
MLFFLSNTYFCYSLSQKDRKNLDKYLKWSDYLILVYNITNYQSFLSAQEYLDSISELLKYNSTHNMDNESIAIPVRILLLGNKLDLERFRQVPKIEVETFIEKYSSANKNLSIKYMESTSCEDYEIVKGIFLRIIRDLRNENRLNMSSQSTRRAKSPGITSNITNTAHNFGHSNTLPNIQLNKETNSKKNQSKFQFFNKVFK